MSRSGDLKPGGNDGSSRRVFPPPGDRGVAAPPVLLFDGECHLCRASVRWLHRHERTPWLRFIPLQAASGGLALRSRSLPSGYRESAVLLEEGCTFVHSSAIVEAIRYCRWPWRALAVLAWVPRSWRDAVYHWIANHRPWVSRVLRIQPPSVSPPGNAIYRFPEWTAGLGNEGDGGCGS